ncbi:MAG: hypothetical protein GF421_12400 [Candidatus Aminicenantes bacterium]|nr:hypothetical protein [Candidatus Aminicenantes bacterium]
MKKAVWISLALIWPLCAAAESGKALKPEPVKAVKTEEFIKIDGVLEEPSWKMQGCTDFVQTDPIDGSDPSERTSVWIAYDEENLYVAAYLYDSNPDQIKCRLGRRDDFVDSDWFIFAVDPYFDRRTGYQFAVNPSGSIVDWTLYNDVNQDTTWNGVWDWASHINDDGWSVEIKIPFDQIRFPKKEEYTWGVNFRRVILRKNEKMTYVWIPKEESAYVSRFAELVGIKGIDPGMHIEVLPYAVSRAQFSPAQQGNPFETGKEFLGDAGFNLKLGLKSNLTLDATVNPDFGQVEVDPAVMNLSAYETYYEEKRPFFIEGANIFNAFGRGGVHMNANINWPSPSFFYSRRIGRAPQGPVSRSGYVDYPEVSRILGAFKLTGKVFKGWDIGFINALTSREFAEIDGGGVRTHEEVEPLTYYGALRVQKDFNEGAQGFGLIATSVNRDLKSQNMENRLNNNAFSLAVDGWSFLDQKRTWVISAWMGATRVEGSPLAIDRIQRSSLHYFQRPDTSHVSLNENATYINGWGGRFNLGKQRGNFVLSFALGALSPGFDPNDIGFQSAASDVINSHLIAGYIQPHPGKVLRNWMLFGGPFVNYDFGGNKTWEGVLLAFQGQFLNYWGFDTMIAYNPETYSKTLTRGGPIAAIPYGYQINASFTSDNRKPVVFSINNSYYNRPDEGFNLNSNVSMRWKPLSSISLSMGPGVFFRESDIMWVTRVKDPLMAATYGTRYVFGRIKQDTLFAEVRLNWTFTPRLTLQLYLQPFIAVGQYDQFKELAEPRSFKYNAYGEGGSTIEYQNGYYQVDPDGSGPASGFSFSNPDFNLKSLRGTMVFRWEYHPGSTLYLVWTQNRADYSNPGDFLFGRDMRDLFTAPGDNIFLFKFSYRWSK